jgi:hydroxyacylglutathione hydrolase
MVKKQTEKVGSVIGLEIHRLESDPFGTNAYILQCPDRGEGLLIDAPGNSELILEKFSKLKVLWIIITHGHADHTMALEELKSKLKAPLAVHTGDREMLPLTPEWLLKDGDRIYCGNQSLEVMHTPGHTVGSICLKIGNYLLAGDTIFPGGPGKTATPADFEAIFRSIQDKILTLPDSTIILPGHGDSTTVGKERKLIDAFSSETQDKDRYGDVTWS